MKKILLLLIVFGRLAFAGSEGVGGGDPDAVDFLLTSKTFSSWASKSNIGLSPQEITKIEIVYQHLSQGMNHQASTPIQFVSEPLTDLSGASKVAIYSKNPLLIKVNRNSWKRLDPTEKFILVSLEILGLSDIEDRYDIAGKIKASIGNLSRLKDDLQLLNFIIGSWKLDGGACLSGQAVNWGNNQKSFDDYELNINFAPTLSYSVELSHKNIPLASEKGNFFVKDSNVFSTVTKSCRYDSKGEPCREQMSQANGLLSINNNQIWILTNQGSLGGSCGPQDVFIAKYERK